MKDLGYFESKKIRKLLIYNNFRSVRETGLETPMAHKRV